MILRRLRSPQLSTNRREGAASVSPVSAMMGVAQFTVASRGRSIISFDLLAAADAAYKSSESAVDLVLFFSYRHRWTGRYEAHLWDKNSWNESQNKKGKQGMLCSFL
ncbi:hypothetical protein BHE74_00016230 [Ensete ventricosum]|nr:hypothetical protein BHE74_00016230 [Ensete ventricosum]